MTKNEIILLISRFINARGDANDIRETLELISQLNANDIRQLCQQINELNDDDFRQIQRSCQLDDNYISELKYAMNRLDENHISEYMEQLYQLIEGERVLTPPAAQLNQNDIMTVEHHEEHVRVSPLNLQLNDDGIMIFREHLRATANDPGLPQQFAGLFANAIRIFEQAGPLSINDIRALEQQLLQFNVNDLRLLEGFVESNHYFRFLQEFVESIERREVQLNQTELLNRAPTPVQFSSFAAMGHALATQSAVKTAIDRRMNELGLTEDDLIEDENYSLYIDPITFSLIKEPVIDALGHTADRSSFAQWFASGKATTLTTNEQLPNLNLIPNRDLQARILSFIEKIAANKSHTKANIKPKG